MKKTIWVIDDDYSILEALKAVLSDKYEVILIDNPDSIENLSSPDIALLDLSVLKNKSPDLKSASLVVMSGDEDVEEKSKKLGAKYFIKKPFSVPELLKLLDSLA
jgi:DNA-binding NtrC family response regulator